VVSTWPSNPCADVAVWEQALPTLQEPTGEAMKNVQKHIAAGWMNEISAAMSNEMPDNVPAEQHRKTAEPGSASH
jgi:hypothetical protein